MRKTPNTFIYVIALFGLIIVGVVTTAIINVVKNNQTAPTDIRARAGVVNIIKLVGTVASVNSADGTLMVENVQFSPESRSGPAINYGTWTVTIPTSFNLLSASVGTNVSFVVNASSFDVATHKVSATQITVTR